MNALSREEFLQQLIEWTEDEYYWYEIIEKDSEKIVISVHKMIIKNPSARKQVRIKEKDKNVE